MRAVHKVCTGPYLSCIVVPSTSNNEPTSCYVNLLIGIMPSPMQLKETQEALVAAAQEGVTIGNAISSPISRGQHYAVQQHEP